MPQAKMPTMANKEFVQQKICIYTDNNFDPDTDESVTNVLRDKFNIRLPQRASLNESLASTASSHEIVELILQYRTMDE